MVGGSNPPRPVIDGNMGVQKMNVLKGKRVAYPKEILYETGLKGDIGIALSRIDESEPHYHNRSTEWYLVTKGSGYAYVGKRRIRLKKYDVLAIPPKKVHYAKSKNGIELWVISSPPWSKGDHYIVK